MKLPSLISFSRVILTVVLAASGCSTPQASYSNSWNPFARKLAAEKSNPVKAHHPRQHTDVEMEMARSWEQQGEIDRALNAYAKLVQTESHRGEAYHRLAVLNDLKGQSQQAQHFYQQALKQEGPTADLLCDFGYSQLLRGQMNEAEATLRQAISMQPKMARAHNNLGLVLAGMGRSDEAIRQFMSAGCNENEARVNLNNAQLWFDDRDQAEKLLELALARQASSRTVQQASFHVADTAPNQPQRTRTPGPQTPRPKQADVPQRPTPTNVAQTRTTPPRHVEEPQSAALVSKVEADDVARVDPPAKPKTQAQQLDEKRFFDDLRAKLAGLDPRARPPAATDIPRNPLRTNHAFSQDSLRNN